MLRGPFAICLSIDEVIVAPLAARACALQPAIDVCTRPNPLQPNSLTNNQKMRVCLVDFDVF
jgi:hypothetical protein